MRTMEQAPDFGMGMFDMGADFDINAAFQEAAYGVMTDSELAVEEKIKRMEVIIHEGSSEVYRDFVDFRAMATQMEMMCSHDHALNQSMKGNESLSSFMDGFKSEDGHNYSSLGKHAYKEDDEIDSKTGKKKKKRGWFETLLK